MIVAQEFPILPSPSRVNKLSQDARGLVHRKVLWWHPSSIVFFESERASFVVARPGGECVGGRSGRSGLDGAKVGAIRQLFPRARELLYDASSAT